MQPDTFFEDIDVGQVLWSPELVADGDEMLTYNRQFDPWPIHVDEEAAAASPYGGLIASGGYTIGLWYRAGHEVFNQPGQRLAFLGGMDWSVRFVAPLRPEDRVRLRMEMTDKRLSSKPGRGIVTSETALLNQRDEPVLALDLAWLVATKPTGA